MKAWIDKLKKPKTQNRPQTNDAGDIAIVGLALRFPGSENLEEFWQHLSSADCLISEAPTERWGGASTSGDTPQKAWGGFIEQADCFDADFFNISPREAKTMDPQQRFALELSWQALEDAGYAPSALSGSRTGVFMGACHWDYAELYAKSGLPVDAYMPTGMAYSIIANRVSHYFDFSGPSVVNDTACSSSLVAVIQAVQALRSNECEMALAGGVNLIWSPDHFIAFDKNGMLSKTGRSRAFDKSADGYVRGEGGAILVLKRLQDALDCGDPIHAVVKGGGTNHGGRTNSLTVTNPKAQSQLIKDVCDASNIAPQTIGYVEAHGTGTPIGDPIEVLGLKSAFKNLYETSGTNPVVGACGLGSVKTNIGHLEGASGVAGMAKVIAAMQHKTLPPNAGFEEPNPMLKLDGSPFYIVDRKMPWPSSEGGEGVPRRAGVSSFGFGGTNAHVLLEDAPDVSLKSTPKHDVYIVPVSARDHERLNALIENMVHYIDRHRDTLNIADIAHTLQVGRDQMQARGVFVIKDTHDLIAGMQKYLTEPDVPLNSVDKVSQPDIRSLFERRDLDRLGSLWAAGLDLDWRQLYQDQTPTRIHLPTYLFARERHWFSTAVVKNEGSMLGAVSSVGGVQTYAITLSAKHYLLLDHRIGDDHILPGVVALEWVREAMQRDVGAEPATIELRNVVWLRPLKTDGDTLQVELTLKNMGAKKIGFEFSLPNVAGEGREVCCQGVAEQVADNEKITQPPVKGERSLDVEACYQRLKDAHIHHGPAFRALQKIDLCDGEVLASLSLPRAAKQGDATWGCHPVLLDAAIQANAALLNDEMPPGVPFAIDSIKFTAPCGDAVTSVVRRSGAGTSQSGISRFDIDIFNAEGAICVEMRGLVMRSQGILPVTDEHTLQLAIPVWEAGEGTTAPTASRNIVVLVGGEVEDLDAKFAKTVGEGATLEVFALPANPRDIEGVNRVIHHILDKARLLMNAPDKTHMVIVLPNRVGAWLSPALAAAVKTINQESGRVEGRVVTLEANHDGSHQRADDSLSYEVLLNDASGEVRFGENGTREVRRFVTSDDMPATGNFKRSGLYWIAGGLGALGQAFARHLILSGVEKVILSGRLSKEDAQRKLDVLSDLGDAIEYWPVDVMDRTGVDRAVAEMTARFGSISGVIHAAGVIRDGLTIHKKDDDISAVMGAKVQGLINLDGATAHLDLDVFVSFSSIASLHGNSGQVDYAAANGFLDGFSAWRNSQVDAGSRHGRSVAINWPLFADGGMHVSDDIKVAMERRMGTVPLPSAQGLRAFDRICAGAVHPQVAVGFGHAQVMPRFFASGNATQPVAAPLSAVASGKQVEDTSTLHPAVTERVRSLFAETLAMDPAKVRTDVLFETYGFDSIIAIELINRLEGHFGELPKTLFFEHTNLNSVIDWLLEERTEQVHTVFSSADSNIDSEATPQGSEAVVPDQEQPAPIDTAQNESRDALHDIAVIGVGGLYPGSGDLDEFWENLKDGKHAFEAVPAERWRHGDIYHPERDVSGKSTIQTGSFLSDIDKFDPRYFNVSQRDAELMSPEVRLMLQVAVETFENAGYSRETIQQKFDGDVGVLTGTMSNHYNLYGVQNMMARGAQASGSYTGTLPNMVSYYYGLSGPSVFVDTMCSAASTCIDMGVRMLRTGQCKMVLAGGVNLLLHPHNMISSSQEHFTTKTAEVIRSYGVGADGTILGEGVGAVLLKPLKDAERDGDNIHAVIRGTSLTNAGVRNGFTVPNPTMQTKAVRMALDDAGVEARTISYVEGHGSGTSLGDPIEISALNKAFAHDTQDQGFCAIGSVKSNVAHLLAAAGIVGFTKVLLQLRHGQLVPSLHSEELNPAIKFDASPFVVQRGLTEWKRPELVVDGVRQTIPRRAGVTSIGAGGMNSHIIVEEYQRPESSVSQTSDSPYLFVFSAMHPEALKRVVRNAHSWFEKERDSSLADVSYTLQIGRTALPCRLSFVAHGHGDLQGSLDDFLSGRNNSNLFYVENVLEADMPPEPHVMAQACAERDLSLLASGWVAGAVVEWDRLWDGAAVKRIALPTYPFEKIRCWYDVFEDAPNVLNPEAFRRKQHPFIGKNVSGLFDVGFDTDFRLDEILDYVYRYRNAEDVVGFVAVDVALAVMRLSGIEEVVGLSHMKWSPCTWADVKELHYHVTPMDRGIVEVSATWGDEQGVWHPWFEAQGALGVSSKAGATVPQNPNGDVDVYDRATLAAHWKMGGLSFAPYLDVISKLTVDDNGRGEVLFDAPADRQNHHRKTTTYSPELLGALHQLGQFMSHRFGLEAWAKVVPLALENAHVAGSMERACKIAFALRETDTGLAGDISICSADGNVLGLLSGLSFGQSGLVQEVPQTQIGEAVSIEAEVETVVRREMADILKFPQDEIGSKIGFHALGFDSITLTDLTTRINRHYGTNLTPALFYEVTNMAQLAAYIVDADVVLKTDTKTQARPIALRKKNDTKQKPDEVAVVGVACKFPGAPDLNAYWDLLRDGREGLSDLPLDRYGPLYREKIKAAGFPKQGGFLDGIDRFDSHFFNIAPVEAERMDPQHRLFLETAWSALEMAGCRPCSLPKNTGVFVGVSGHDYESVLRAHNVEADAHTATGNSHAMLANRMSFFLDVHGPSEAIDTACSSSLVAVHRAMESIRGGRCDMAIAGGVNVNMSLESFVGPYKAGMLSPDGRCKTFAADANGYVRGEGVGAVILKPLALAERDGDPVLGVLVGSAENHGGRATSLTAPNASAQTDLIVEAMGDLDPATINYVELHGTGTVLGDPVEVNGLKAAFSKLAVRTGEGHAGSQGCGLASVKTNIGHLEAAAGVAGLIKVLLSMKHELMPQSLHCQQTSPYLNFEDSPFFLLKEAQPWPQKVAQGGGAIARRAGLSSFGFGGANAHVIAQEYLRVGTSTTSDLQSDNEVAIVLSGRTAESLMARVSDLLVELPHLKTMQGNILERLAFTLQDGREPMEERLAFVVRSLDDLGRVLYAIVGGNESGVLRGRVRLVDGFPGAADEGEAAQLVLREQLAHWVNGGSCDWKAPWRGRTIHRLHLPTYKFNDDRHWFPTDVQHPVAPAQLVDTQQQDVQAEKVLEDIIAGDLVVDDAVRILEGAE